METVYKSYKAIQWNGEDKESFKIDLDMYIFNIIIEDDGTPTLQINYYTDIKLTNWLVYSPYKYKWKVYTNSEYISTFKTLKQIQNENQF